jgi:hypothetical protein
VSGRIALHLDRGLGWTKPVFVASCRDCGTELARHTNQATATRAAVRSGPCPTRGSVVGREPGTVHGRTRPPPPTPPLEGGEGHVAPLAGGAAAPVRGGRRR